MKPPSCAVICPACLWKEAITIDIGAVRHRCCSLERAQDAPYRQPSLSRRKVSFSRRDVSSNTCQVARRGDGQLTQRVGDQPLAVDCLRCQVGAEELDDLVIAPAKHVPI